MTTRIFKQQGQAFGTQPTNITVKIDDLEVFSGDIQSQDSPIPPLPGGTINSVDLCTWTNTVEFQGTQTMEISVNGGTLILTNTLANYCTTVNTEVPPEFEPGLENNFGVFYSYTDSDVLIADPLSNVTIDGIAKSIIRDQGLDGQWFWQISSGSVFRATINVNPGYNVQDWTAQTGYTWGQWAKYQGQLYFLYEPRNGNTVTGVLPTNTDNWLNIPLPLWNQTQSYTAGDCVRANSNAYRALQSVPQNIAIDNVTYWQNLQVS